MNAPGIRVVLLLVLAVAASCSTDYKFEARRIESRGFLADWPKPKPAGGGGLPLSHRTPSFDVTAYPRVLVESPSIWRTIEAPLAEVSEGDMERVARFLHDATMAALTPDYRVAYFPKPGALRIRLAVIEAAERWVVLDTFSLLLPPERLASEEGGLSSATAALVGRAGIEVVVSDSVTGDVHLVASDHTLFGRNAEGPATWEAMSAGFKRFGERLRRTVRGEPKSAAPEKQGSNP